MEFLTQIGDYLSQSGTKLAFVICLFIVGICVMLLLAFILKKILLKTPIDNAVISFVISIFKIIWVIALLVICANILNLDTASLVVSLSTIALAISLALKDSFANLANGILIMINKPFRSGDFVSIGGVEGKVWSIKLLTIELVTFDNNKVVLPNSSVLTQEVVNYSAFPVRRVDFVFSVAYGTDMDKVEKALRDVCRANPMVLTNFEPSIFMSAHSASSVDYSLKLWTDTPNYFNVKNAMPRLVYDEFEKQNITIPFNQLDVHIDGNK